MAEPRHLLAPGCPGYSTPDATRPLRAAAHSRSRGTRLGRLFDDAWLGEIIAVGFSCSLVVALCALLRAYEGGQRPHFGNYFNSGITLNTIVSLLATLSVAASLVVLEACISQLKWLWCHRSSRSLADLGIYDRASRGTWGSLQLLWKLPLRLLPSIGAVLMIVSLAIAPLVQQSVRLVQQSVTAADGIAAVPVSDFWTVTIPTENTNETAGFNRINATTKGAVLSGLFYDNDSMPELSPQCTSGNCTFDHYQSLAVCAWTADVSSHLVNTTSKSTGTGAVNATWCLPGNFCLNATGPSPTIAKVLSANGTAAGKIPWQTQDTHGLWLLEYTSIAFQDHPRPITDNYMIYQNTTHPGFRPGLPNNEVVYSAFEFILDWCVPTFETTVVNGSSTTTRLPNPIYDFEWSPPPDLMPLNVTVNGTNYGIDQFTHDSLQRYFWNILPGFIDAVPNVNLTITDSDPAKVLWAATQRNQIELWSSENFQLPSQDEAMPALQFILHNTAVSMSNLVRKHSSALPINGTMTVQQSVVCVDWGYIIALIVFNASVLVFFVSVAYVRVRPRQGAVRTPVWKSTTFATLQGLDPALHAALGSATRTSEMEKDASSVYVRLVHDGAGWRLCPCEQPDVSSDRIPLHGFRLRTARHGTPKSASLVTGSQI